MSDKDKAVDFGERALGELESFLDEHTGLFRLHLKPSKRLELIERFAALIRETMKPGVHECSDCRKTFTKSEDGAWVLCTGCYRGAPATEHPQLDEVEQLRLAALACYDDEEEATSFNEDKFKDKATSILTAYTLKLSAKDILTPAPELPWGGPYEAFCDSEGFWMVRCGDGRVVIDPVICLGFEPEDVANALAAALNAAQKGK